MGLKNPTLEDELIENFKEERHKSRRRYVFLILIIFLIFIIFGTIVAIGIILFFLKY